MDYPIYLLHCAFSPNTLVELGIYYFIWMVIFIGINIVWDIYSPRTKSFHFSMLKSKTPTAYAAATFSSSFVVLLSIVNKSVASVVGETYLPLILAGITGVLHSISEICPYSPDASSDTL